MGENAVALREAMLTVPGPMLPDPIVHPRTGGRPKAMLRETSDDEREWDEVGGVALRSRRVPTRRIWKVAVNVETLQLSKFPHKHKYTT